MEWNSNAENAQQDLLPLELRVVRWWHDTNKTGEIWFAEIRRSEFDPRSMPLRRILV